MSKHRTNKVFEIDYLINEDLTEEDLFYIFETPSLVHSLVIGMFEQINTKLNFINIKRYERESICLMPDKRFPR